MANPPTLTPEQRQLALEKAAVARRQRAEVKDKLKIGSLTLRELFEAAERGDESGDMLAKLKVVSVLESLPGRRQGARPSHHVGARDLREPAAAGAGHEPASGAPREVCRLTTIASAARRPTRPRGPARPRRYLRGGQGHDRCPAAGVRSSAALVGVVDDPGADERASEKASTTTS